MAEFKKKSVLDLLTNDLKDLEQYYRELRKYNYEKKIPIKGMKIRDMFYKIPIAIVRMERLIKKQKIVILEDKRKKVLLLKYMLVHILVDKILKEFLKQFRNIVIFF